MYFDSGWPWFKVGEAYRAVLEDKLSVERPPLSFAATSRKSAAGYKAGRCEFTPVLTAPGSSAWN